MAALLRAVVCIWLCTLAGPTRAADGWSFLGQEPVSGGRTVVPMARGDGRIMRIRVEIGHGSMYVDELRVVYDTGASERLRLGLMLAAGQTSAEYDLAGYGNRVAAVEIFGEPGPSHGGRALVRVFGERGPSASSPNEEAWIMLGAGTSSQRDTVRIGPRAGRFSATALNVSGGSVVLSRISIVFPDGRRASYPVNKEIPDGTFTPGIVLERPGPIDRVELSYAFTEPGAVIEVHGLPIP
jgi:hypothetical protein